MKLFHVLHHEFMGVIEPPLADEMLFYTASSLKKAIAMIKRAHTCPWSWWEIQVQDLDRQEWPEHFGYYGPRGGKLAAQPWAKCLALFQAARKRGEI